LLKVLKSLFPKKQKEATMTKPEQIAVPEHAYRLKREVEYLSALEEELAQANRAAATGDPDAALERETLLGELTAQQRVIAKLQREGSSPMSARGIEAALWATCTRDAEIRESKAGNPFGIINVIVHDGTTDDQGRQVGTFVKVLAFQQHVNTATTIKKGDRLYTEGQLSASIWKTNDGEPRLDLTVKAFVLQKTGIGKNRPPREGVGSNSYAPPDASRQQHDFDDAVPFRSLRDAPERG
jgi:single-stranded DNA-binding protein